MCFIYISALIKVLNLHTILQMIDIFHNISKAKCTGMFKEMFKCALYDTFYLLHIFGVEQNTFTPQNSELKFHLSLGKTFLLLFLNLCLYLLCWDASPPPVSSIFAFLKHLTTAFFVYGEIHVAFSGSSFIQWIIVWCFCTTFK